MTTTRSDQAVGDLEQAVERIWEIARGFGLDPFPVHFELVPASVMYEFGAYGLPGRFSHWTHGRAFHQMKTMYDYGLQRIYELVINANPAYAFLLESNSVLQNKLVVAHVLGHSDCFKHNAYFGPTSRRMLDTVSASAGRFAGYEFEHGAKALELLLDAVLSIEEYVETHPFVRRRDPKREKHRSPGHSSAYDDVFQFVRQPEPEAEEVAADEEDEDLLRFVAEHAPDLTDWERDVITSVRTEALYFQPQGLTKILNEGWACLVGASLVHTDEGLLPFAALYDRLERGEAIRVLADDGTSRRVRGWHRRAQCPTVRLYTRRGLVIEGAEAHRVCVGSDQWLALEDVQVGQRLPLSVGAQCWPAKAMTISAPPRVSAAGVGDVARVAGVGAHTVYRYLGGATRYRSDQIALAIAETGFRPGNTGKPMYGNRQPITLPDELTEEVATFLGYLIGDGNIHVSKGAVGYTSGDAESVRRYADLIDRLFGIRVLPFWDSRTANGRGGRWRVVFYSRDILDWLQGLGIDLHAKARQKRIPEGVLRSPRSVVSAFLRAYFDCDACASEKHGAILSTFSDHLALAVQVLLLNFGILSRRNGPNVGIRGKSAQRFYEEIGFGLTRKQEILRRYVNGHQWYKAERADDEVVRIERDVADVFDLTVDQRHCYVANGMVHHNSFWHSRIIRELDLSDGEYHDFAEMNAGVLARAPMQLNPYFLGLKLLEDIERRWDKGGGEGRAKLFEVREMESDVSLIRNYLTQDLVEELDLYTYALRGRQWVIVEKDWEKVRDQLVEEVAGRGRPAIVAVSADYAGRRELHLRHLFRGVELDAGRAEKTLRQLYHLWRRPVHLETSQGGRRVFLTYDGRQHSARSD